MASIWDSSGSKVIKTQTTIDPGLLKAAAEQEKRSSGPQTTLATTTDMGAARLADKHGGKPSDYRGMTVTQLADKLGGKPSDYKFYVPADTYIPPANDKKDTPKATPPPHIGPGGSDDKTDKTEDKKESDKPPVDFYDPQDPNVSGNKSDKQDKNKGADPQPEPEKATDLDSVKPAQSGKADKPASAPPGIGPEQNILTPPPEQRKGDQIESTGSGGLIYDASQDNRKDTTPDMGAVTDKLPQRGDVFKGGIVTGVDQASGLVSVSTADRITANTAANKWYVLADGDWVTTGPTGLLTDVLYGDGKTPDLNYDVWKSASDTIKKYDSPVEAVADGVTAETLQNAGYSSTMANALVELKPYIKGDNVDIQAALDAGVSTKTLGQIGVSVTDINSYKSFLADAKKFKESHTQLEDGRWVNNEDLKAAEKATAEAIRNQALRLADVIGLKPSDILNPDGSINSTKVADELGGKPSDYKTIEDVMDRSTEIDSGRFKDSVKEILTFGQAKTKTFNTDDLAAEWDSLAAEAASKGMVLTESKDEYITKTLNQQSSTGEIVRDFAIGMVPVVGTAAHWDKMGAGGKALAVATDLLVFAPALKLVRAARVEGATAKRALADTAIAEFKSPLTTLTKPVQTAKTAYGTVEEFVMPKTIPLQSVETSFHTFRIPVKAVGDNPKLAIELREQLMDNVAKGKGGTAKVDDVTATIDIKGVNTNVKPSLWSLTPDVRPFLEGVKVGRVTDEMIEKYGPAVMKGKDKPLFVAPTPHTRFSTATSGGVQGSKGAVPGGIIIRDRELLNKVSNSPQGLYGKTAEIEAVLKQGVEIPKDKIKQVVFGRDAAGNKLTFLVVGEKYTPAELAKLKLVGPQRLVKDIVSPQTYVKIKGATKYDELLDAKKEAAALKAQAKADPKNLKLARKAEAAELKARRLAKNLELKAGVEGYAYYAGTYSRADSLLKPLPREKVRAAARAQTKSSRAGVRAGKSGPTRRGIDNAGRALLGGVVRRPGEEPRETTMTGSRVVPSSERVTPTEERPVPTDERYTPEAPRVTPPGKTNPPPPTKATTTTQVPPTNDDDDDKKKERPKMGDGDAAWIQGYLKRGDGGLVPQWIVVRKNGQREYHEEPPEGAPRLHGTPRETFFTRGDEPVQDARVRMGITTAEIDLNDSPAIDFIRAKTPKIGNSIPRSVRRKIGM